MPALYFSVRTPVQPRDRPAAPDESPDSAVAQAAIAAAQAEAAAVVAAKATKAGKAGKEAAEHAATVRPMRDAAPVLPPAPPQAGNIFLLAAGEESKSPPETFSVFTANLMSEVSSPRFLLLVPTAFINVLNASFYLPSTAYLMPDAYSMNQIAHMFPFVFAPLWGLVADYVGIVPTMASCNLVTILAHALLLPRHLRGGRQQASAIFSAMRLGFLASQVYCYSNTTFSARNTGTLIGITWTLAGLDPIAAGAMRKRGLETGNFRAMLATTVGLAVLNAIIIAVLFYLIKKKSVTSYRLKEDAKRKEAREEPRPLMAPLPNVVVECLRRGRHPATPAPGGFPPPSRLASRRSLPPSTLAHG